MRGIAAATLFFCAAASGETAGAFREVTEQAGLTHIQGPEHQPGEGNSVDAVTGGGAVGDFFGNGRNDLFVTRLDDTDILYKNMGDGTFEDRTKEVFGKYTIKASTNGALLADLDNDGDLDLYVTVVKSRRHYLFINDGEDHLVERAVQRGAALEREDNVMGMSVTAGDYTGNGYLDLYISDWSDRESPNRLLRNRGSEAPGFFEDVTEAAGLAGPNNRWGLGARFADMNRDGLPDLIPYNDFNRNQFFWNNGDGTFREAVDETGTSVGTHEMGISVADFNNNGWMDVFITDIDANILYRNEMHRNIPGLYFTELAREARVFSRTWGWGAGTLDYNNDGWRDLVMVNGYFTSERMRFWRNEGDEDLSFTEMGNEVGLVDDGEGRGLIVADFTGNGWQDILILNNADRPVLYENLGGDNDWLRIDLVGQTSNRQGVGAWITVTPDLENPHIQFVHEVNLEANYLSHSETTAHFGLGDLEGGRVDRVHIRWPSGLEQEVFDLEPNQVHTIAETPPSAGRARFEAAVTDAALSGAEAEPDATPYDDGVNNLLKYAFNMDLSRDDRRTLTPGGGEGSGLPCVFLEDEGPERVLVIEFIRRRNSGLIYEPKWSTDLSVWHPVLSDFTAIEIDSEWERPSVRIPLDPAVTRGFGKVDVTLP